VLDSRTILERDELTVSDVRCTHGRGSATAAEPAPVRAIVFVRRGCFVRRVEGAESTLDPTLAYCMNPGEVQRYDHPHADGDDCTAIGVPAEWVASVWGGEPDLPGGTIPTTPGIDLRHRMLLAGGMRGDDQELYEQATLLVAEALETVDERRVACGRPASARARRALADGAREALTEDPDRSLHELARLLATSPHHLSRAFSVVVGHSVSRHRMRLRTRMALELLAEGHDNLARLAADVGFADQSHLCRVVRDETGRTPSALRRLMQAAGPHQGAK
jgi:AraC-like DNA-binding protein